LNGINIYIYKYMIAYEDVIDRYISSIINTYGFWMWIL